jgi:flagellar hook-length control protein FliK
MTAPLNLAASLPTSVAPPATPRTGTGEGADTGFAQCLDQARDDGSAAGVDMAPDAARDTPRTPGKQKAARSAAPADAQRRGAPGAEAAKALAAPAALEIGIPETELPGGKQDDASDGADVDLSALLPGWSAPTQPTPAAAVAPVPAAAAGDEAAKAAPSLPTAADDPQGGAVALALGIASGRAAAVAAAADDSTLGRVAPPETAPTDIAARDVARPAGAQIMVDILAQGTAAIGARVARSTQRSDHDAAGMPSPAFSLLPVGTATQPPPAAPVAASPASAHIAAAVDSPAFAPSLATQVRWLVRDGVQRAELTLNPAEMGPVAVQIMVIDGREARIDFSADLAATRSAIEASLPVLAAALDDNGLKLAGGGVHDGQARHQPAWAARTTTQTHGTEAPLGDDTASARTAAVRTEPQRGLVDLVA